MRVGDLAALLVTSLLMCLIMAMLRVELLDGTSISQGGWAVRGPGAIPPSLRISQSCVCGSSVSLPNKYLEEPYFWWIM
jgi:hypothetical protein